MNSVQHSHPSADEFRLAIDTIPGLVWRALPDGYVDFLNRQWYDYTGLTLEQLSGWGWKVAIHPDDLPRLLDYWMSLLAAGEPGEMEARLRRADGNYRWFLIRAIPLCDHVGAVIRWYGQTTDVDDRKRAEGLLAGENRLLDMVAKGDTLPVVLDAVCRVVEETATGSLCSVLLVTPDGKHLRVAAGPSLPSSFTHALDDTEILAGVGPDALAALSSERVIAENFERDARWSRQFRHLALLHQLRACWSSPIRSLGGSVLGTFALYYREARSPTAAEENIIEQFTRIARTAIERSQTEDAFRRIHAYHSEAQRLSRTGSFSWDVRSGEITWSDEVYRIYGYEPTVKPTMELARRRLHPDDVTSFNETARRALHDGNEIQFDHRLLMPDGSVKWLHVVSTAVRDGAGKVLEYIGAVRDVTDQRRSETR